MNSIILCEGETDQILISYYFIVNLGFTPVKNAKDFPACVPKKLNPQNNAEKIWSYYREKDNLIIWAVGGHDDVFENALKKVLYQNKIDSLTNGSYSRICIITDHDSDKELAGFWERISECLAHYGIEDTLKEREWISTLQNTDFGQCPVSLLGLPVPLTEDGALETLLLDALGKEEGNSYLAEKAKSFIRHLLDNSERFSDKYLSSRRDRIKAPLAVFLGVTVPERTFVETDKLLKSIPWKNYADIQKLFAPFSIFINGGNNQT